MSGQQTDEQQKDDDDNICHRDILVFNAQMCEQSGRFEDMVKIMGDLCEYYDDLTDKERNLLSCSYKNVIGSRRTSWRILSETLRTHSNTSKNSDPNNVLDTDLREDSQDKKVETTRSKEPLFDAAIIRDILNSIESELKHHCGNIIDTLNTRLIPSVSAVGESRVFYYKMKGDYMRYLCEICSQPEQNERANEALVAYKTACDKATIELPPTHPVRLGLMLNFSVFYYDIMKSPERSCRLAKQAFDDAIAELDTLSEESYRDSTIIMQLLRDNLNLWESEQNLQLNNELVV